MSVAAIDGSRDVRAASAVRLTLGRIDPAGQELIGQEARANEGERRAAG